MRETIGGYSSGSLTVLSCDVSNTFFCKTNLTKKNGVVQVISPFTEGSTTPQLFSEILNFSVYPFERELRTTASMSNSG
jgi:hypothetical protein